MRSNAQRFRCIGKARPITASSLVTAMNCAMANFPTGITRRGRRNTIAARGGFPWKTTTDGGEVNVRAHLRFSHSAEFVKPAEQGAACGPGERPRQHRLLHARCLADKQYLA